MAENNNNLEGQKLRKISNEELKDILMEHKKWIKSDKKEGKQADLNYTDLSRRDFQEANLQRAKLRETKLKEANLKEANLQVANLQEADLRIANLQEADLQVANLKGADLRIANLKRANLGAASLQGANLWRADLGGANLWGVDLSKANLRGANFESVHVTGVKYNRWSRYQGIRVETCYGSARFKRFAQDQDFIEEFRSYRWRYPIYLLWLIFADCGRSIWIWLAWSVALAIFFGHIFFQMGPDAFVIDDLPWRLSTMIYYSVVTFTTLGFGDITPKTSTAAWWIMAEVVLGYIMLGGLISILATKLARRS